MTTDTSFREALTVEQIRCETDVAKISNALALIKGIEDARIEIGSSVVVVEYRDRALRKTIDTALDEAGYGIIAREERDPWFQNS